MEGQTRNVACKLSLVGAILIFINTMSVAINSSPLIISHSIPYTNNVNATVHAILDETSWARLSLGLPGLIEGPFVVVFLTIASLNLFLSLAICVARRIENLSLLILVLTLLSAMVGGGFIIGLILGVLGSTLGLNPRAPLKQNFFVKIFRAIRLDSALFSEAKNTPTKLRESAFTIIFINIISSLGCGIYTYNAEKIINSTPENAFRILVLGDVFWDNSILSLPIINVSLAVLKWILLSCLLYFVGTKMMGCDVDLSQIARVIPFAYAPIMIQALLPIIFGSEPLLSINWPTAILFVSNLWMILALILATKQVFDITTMKATGVVMFSGTMYWLIVYKMMYPMFQLADPAFRMPGIMLDITPLNFVLIFVSVAVFISIVMGVFARRYT